jgi:hypothetical protein
MPSKGMLRSHRSRELAMRDIARKHNNAAGQEH